MLTHEFPPFPGGVATYCAELARAAHEIGHEVTVVAPDFGTADLGRRDSERPYQVRRFSGGQYHLRSLVPLLLRTARLTRRGDYDLVHAADWPFVMALAFLNRFREISFVATVFGTDLLGARKARQVRLLGVGNMYEVPRRVFAISDFTRSILFETYPRVDPGRVVTTPLGVNPFWFGTPDEAGDFLERLKIPAGKKIILTVARLDERKGHRTVLQALERLPEEVQSDLIYIVVGKPGDPAYHAELQDLAARSGVEVIFAGVLSNDDLRRLYAMAYLFCMPGEPHPGKVEGFGLVYLEAAAQGVPSVASNISAVPEVVRDGETGVLIPALGPQALSDYLRQLLAQPDRVEQLGKAARNWAEKFTWGACALKTYGRPGE